MESQSAAKPLKVCPYCSVATRTDAAECPSCGRSYVRRAFGRPRWRWWMAVPIVIAAFWAGYGITKAVGTPVPGAPPGAHGNNRSPP